MNFVRLLLGSVLLVGGSCVVRSGRGGGRAALSARRLTTSIRGAMGDLPKTDEAWRAVLSPNVYAVLRKAATEPPGYSETTPGELEFELKTKMGTKYPKEGIFACAGCDTPLYEAKSKFDSSCGWPAFYEGIPGAIREVPDPDGRRIEIVCAACGGHQGHVFKGEGFPTPTNERHCVNGIAIKYIPAK